MRSLGDGKQLAKVTRPRQASGLCPLDPWRSQMLPRSKDCWERENQPLPGMNPFTGYPMQSETPRKPHTHKQQNQTLQVVFIQLCSHVYTVNTHTRNKNKKKKGYEFAMGRIWEGLGKEGKGKVI